MSETLSKAEIRRMNAEFIDMCDKTAEVDEFKKTAADVTYTRQHESSSLDKIMVPKPLTISECQRDVNTDSAYALEEIAEEVDVAMILDWLGQPTGQYLQGERYIIPLIVISSPRFWKTLKQIRVYEHPFTEFIERSASNEIFREKDQYFVDLCDTAITATGKLHTTTTVKDLTREDFKELFNLLDGDELQSKKIWMRLDDFNELLTWKSADLDIKAGDTAWNGIQTATILGREVIVTIKNVFDKGEMFCFCDEKYLGKHYRLEDLKFELEKRFGIVQFQSELEMGVNFGNVYGLSKMVVPQS